MVNISSTWLCRWLTANNRQVHRIWSKTLHDDSLLEFFWCWNGSINSIQPHHSIRIESEIQSSSPWIWFQLKVNFDGMNDQKTDNENWSVIISDWFNWIVSQDDSIQCTASPVNHTSLRGIFICIFAYFLIFLFWICLNRCCCFFFFFSKTKQNSANLTKFRWNEIENKKKNTFPIRKI